MKFSWNIETQHGRPWQLQHNVIRSEPLNTRQFAVVTCFDNWAALGPWRARAAAIRADTWAILSLLADSSKLNGCKGRRSCFPTGLKMAIGLRDSGGQYRNFTCTGFRLWKILTQLLRGSLPEQISSSQYNDTLLLCLFFDDNDYCHPCHFSVDMPLHWSISQCSCKLV